MPISALFATSAKMGNFGVRAILEPKGMSLMSLEPKMKLCIVQFYASEKGTYIQKTG